MKKLLYIFSALLILFTLLSLLPAGWWWIRIFDFPRIQIIILIIPALAAYTHFIIKKKLKNKYEFVLPALLLLSAIYQVFMLFPYTVFGKVTVQESIINDDKRKLTLMIANVYMENHESERFLEIVNSANPDIIILTEPDKWWEEKLTQLDTAYPYNKKYPLENTYGMILYSKLPLVNPEVKFILKNDIPSIYSRLVLRSGDTVNLYCVHPEPPRPNVDVDDRDVELLLTGAQAKASAGPDIVAGDLNDVAWSHTNYLFQRISGLLDPRKGRGFYNTFNANYFFLRWSLDHVFFSEEFMLKRMERLPGFGSDHFPLFIELTYEPENKHLNIKPEPAPSDKREAEEKKNENK